MVYSFEILIEPASMKVSNYWNTEIIKNLTDAIGHPHSHMYSI